MLAHVCMSDAPESTTAESKPEPAEERDYAIVIFKVAAYGFIACFGLLAIAWVVFRVGVPSPARVCDHKMELALKEAEGSSSPAVQNMLDRLRDHCVEDKRRRIQLRGQVAYWKYARCVLSSETFADSELC